MAIHYRYLLSGEPYIRTKDGIVLVDGNNWMQSRKWRINQFGASSQALGIKPYRRLDMGRFLVFIIGRTKTILLPYLVRRYTRLINTELLQILPNKASAFWQGNFRRGLRFCIYMANGGKIVAYAHSCIPATEH